MDKQLMGFNTTFEAETGDSFLVLSREGFTKKDVIGYQVEMVNNNDIPGVVKFDLREKNGEVKLYYNLTGLISLSSFLKRHKLSKNQFIAILERLLQVLLESPNFFLTDKSFVLDENFVFIDPNSSKIALLYLPVDLDQQVNNAFKAFLINLIINTANIEAKDNFIQKLLALLKTSGFNLKAFNDKVKSLKVEKIGLDTITQPVPDNIIPFTTSKVGSNKDGTKDKKKAGGKKTKPNKRLILLALFGASVVILAFALNSPGGLKANNDMLIGASVLAAAGVLYCFYKPNRELKEVKNKKPKVIPINKTRVEVESHPQAKPYQQVVSPSQGSSSVAAIASSPVTSEPITDSPPVFTIPAEPSMFTTSFGMEETTILSGVSDETLLLEQLSNPILKSSDGEHMIRINKPDFIIGRNKETCDYVILDKSIGRAHAQLKKINNKLFILDLDSKNGTFVNGTRIDGNNFKELQDNDKLTLAELEFSVCL